MTTRTVTGNIKTLTDSAVSSGTVTFEKVVTSTTGNTIHQSGVTTATTDSSGDFSIALAVPASGSYRYRMILPNGASFYFSIASGASVNVATLIEAETITDQDAVVEALAAYLPLAGGTMTGALTLSGAPTVDLHAATKKYVDDNAGGGANTAEEVGAANVFNVKSAAYGAVGDGVADDTAAILAAIAAAKVAGGGTVFLPKGTYLISKSLIMPSSVELRGAGVQSKITKAATVKSLLTANASAGATSVTVTDSTGFAIGKAIHIYDTSSFEWLSTQAVITDITGNVITFDDALDGAVQTARSAAATTSFPLLRNEAGATDIVVRDLTLDQNSNASDPANDFTLSIIHWVGAYRALVENCTLINACGDAYSDQAQDGTGLTPAANLIVTCKNTIRGCKIRNAGRHAIHLGTCIRGGYILDNDIYGCLGYAYFYCAYVTETIAANNRIENCLRGFAGIDERDYDNIIIGNTVKNCLAAGYALEAIGASGGRLIIANNHFITDETVGAGTYTARCYFDVPDSIFEGNIINMAAKTGEALRIGLNADRSTVTGNRIIGTSGAGGTTGVQIDAVDDLRFSNNLVLTFSKAVSVRGAVRMIADGNKLAPVSTCWNFETSTSTDCVIKNERTTFATPVTEGVAPTRLIYEGIGTNGSDDPASAGAWNGISGRRFDGTLVRWNSGGGEKISIFYNGVGWTTLN